MFRLQIILQVFFILEFSGCNGKVVEPGDRRTWNKIYVELKSITSACFRNLNVTHQVGCSSSNKGNVGVLHYLETKKDAEWIMKTGPTVPFIVLMNAESFTLSIVQSLVDSKRVNGILVISLKNRTQPTQSSADKSCPNDAYGLYHKNKEYGGCKDFAWNEAGDGMFFHDLGIPIFAVVNETDLNELINNCYLRFNKPVNGTARPYPLCAVQLIDVMEAAKDSRTCIRRSKHITNLNDHRGFCDALGDMNVVATIKALKTTNATDHRKPKSVILVGTQMDSFSMFWNEFMSADNTITGIVALLAVAEAIGKYRDDIINNPDSKDILFSFFQGEAFDYIGSSRMVYEMEKDRFPVKQKDKNEYLKKINITDLSHFVELRQVGRYDEKGLYIHTDPLSQKKPEIQSEVQKMVQILKNLSAISNLKIQSVDQSQALPPSSVQRFLMKKDIPAVVITDHRKAYTNKYFNSHLDLPKFINASSDNYDDITEQSDKLTTLSTTVARYLYKLSTGTDPPDVLKADPMTVTHLLYCFTHPPQCELFNRSVDEIDAKSLKDNKYPFPFYVSISSNVNHITSLTQRLLAQYIGERAMNRTSDTCKNKTDQVHTYLWMQGEIDPDTKKRDGWCIRSTAILSPAMSPAFLDEMASYDWNSGVYSTWTESVWLAFKVQMFLIPSEQFQTMTLSVGVIIILSSFLLVYFINARSSIIFNHSGSPRFYTY